MTPDELQRQLQKQPPAPAYLFLGPEAWQRELCRKALIEQLASAQIEVRGADLDAPSNVGSVGQSGVTVGLIETGPNHPKAIWLWAVADNFRITVDSAIEVTSMKYTPVALACLAALTFTGCGYHVSG